ncbi:MAG: conjugal transfer protein TraX [Oscillospiraceae bacterium]|nr:conjugal transfer protein TraX [Oscillospiraceae bacterium]
MLRLNAYQLKWVAIIGMVTSHMVWAWAEIMPLWLMIPMMGAGGLTFPIMAYFVVEGYRHTSNLKRYLLRLFVFGVISIPFYVLTFRSFALNIMFSIMLGIFAMMLYDKLKSRALFWIVFLLVFVPVSLVFDWYFMSIGMIMMYYVIKNENARRIVPSVFGGVCWFLIIAFGLYSHIQIEASGNYAALANFEATWGNLNFFISSLFMVVGMAVAVALLVRYQGERGKRMKWTFYVMYPLHFAVIGTISLLLGLVDFSVFGL